ncbi:hypothetical protein Tco_0952276 [Tanacetum coccineum]|uniref:Uncharacterized protein n=1 Tax=Tanacetum coccineum TaxID=301880 RepID=A0ABQ5DZC0_9ASTR
MLQRFNMPTQTIPMLSKKPKKATADLHKDILGTRNPGLGYMAKRAQPVLYDADTLFHPTHHRPIYKGIVKRSWFSPSLLAMKKMKRNPGHGFDPQNGLLSKLNALMSIDTSSASNAIFEINKLRDQLQGKDTTIRNLDAQINIMKVLNKTGESQKKGYDELSKANTHSRTAYTEKINALTAENAKLKTELSGKKSGGSTASEKPKVLASGMYTKSSKYIPPPKRANWVKPTPLPKKKQVTFQEPLGL